MLGDNAYDVGTDAPVHRRGSSCPTRRCCATPASGRSTATTTPPPSDAATLTGPYFESFSLPRQAQAGGVASVTEAWYSFDRGPVHVVVLDSAESSLAAGAPMLAWLEARPRRQRPPLDDRRGPPSAVHEGHPRLRRPGRLGRADGRGARPNVLPILEAHGVDLVLSGHSHTYERSFLLDGHYGDSSTFDPGAMVLDGGDGDPAGDGAYVKSGRRARRHGLRGRRELGAPGRRRARPSRHGGRPGEPRLAGGGDRRRPPDRALPRRRRRGARPLRAGRAGRAAVRRRLRARLGRALEPLRS